MQKLLSEAGNVLKADGSPNPGYSTREVLQYRRGDIRANPFRIKEWDFYQIEDREGRYCLQLTYGHASYIGQIGVMMFDISTGKFIVNQSVLTILPFGSMHLPESASKDNLIDYHKGKTRVHFETRNHERNLHLVMENGFEAKLHLTPMVSHALIINIPFDQSPRQFYYNYKLNCMDCEGTVYYTEDGQKKALCFGQGKGETPAYALLDWGRGVWPFSNEWFWSNGTGEAEGKLLGFNLGCGFGNTSQATENILFYEGEPHKLGKVKITHQADYMKPWSLQDEEGRCNLKMTPEYDRVTRDKILFVNNCTHQVFGRFNGTVTLDDGRILHVSNLPAFAEHAVNNW